MAIREVLVSFTFEQQRQMINLIGTDVGDASLLLTPTNVVVTAINEVINGDVDLANQTIGMDDGTLASPSLFWDSGQGFYKVDANKLGLTTSLAITGDLEVDGTTTQIDSTTLTVADKDIVIASGATTSGQADEAGIIVGSNIASIKYDDDGTKWKLDKNTEVTGTFTASGAITASDGFANSTFDCGTYS